MYLTIPPIANRNVLNAPLIDIIVSALKGMQLEGNDMIAYRYLLNQAIREYIIPDDNWHLSVAAKELWDSITSDCIKKYNYKQIIECNRANQSPAKKYKGNSSKGSKIKIHKNDKIPFNQLFTAEHMTPVADVIDVLEKLLPSQITPSNVQNILDQIHICRVTKYEDKQIYPKYGRGLNINNILKNAYKNIPMIY